MADMRGIVTLLLVLALLPEICWAEGACAEVVAKCKLPGEKPAFCKAMTQYSGSQPGNLGKYPECSSFEGMQHCTVTATGGPKNCKKPIGECNMGLCMPDVCTPKEVAFFLTLQLSDISKELSKTTLPNPIQDLISANWNAQCEPVHKKPLSWDAWLAIGVIVALLVVGVAETTYRQSRKAYTRLSNYRVADDMGLTEMRAPLLPNKTTDAAPEPTAAGVATEGSADNNVGSNSSGNGGRAPQPTAPVKESTGWFDIVYNINDLFLDPPKGTVTCINGVRTLSMVWVVLGHTGDYMPSSNGMDFASVDVILKLLRSFWWQAVMAGPYAVDTFFFIGGFLLGLITLKKIRRAGKASFMMLPYMYIHRVWRILPLYAFIVMFFCCLTPYMGSGPLWHRYVDMVDKEKTYWYSNLLFINNFYPLHFRDACMGWAWFLAVDMQLYIVFAPFVIFYFYFPIITSISMVFLTLLSAGLRLGLNIYWDIEYYNQGMGDTEDGNEDKADMHDVTYNKIYTRMGPYIIGMLVGFLLEKLNRKEDNKSRALLLLKTSWFAFLSFCFGIGLMAYLIFYPQTGHLGDVYWSHDPPVWGKTFGQMWISWNTTGWALAVALVLWPCMIGKGWVLDRFLSYSIWNPMAKLTYIVYLVHPILMRLTYFQMDHAIHFDIPIFVGYFLLFYLSANVVAVFVYGFIEKPLANINIDPVIKTIFCMKK